MRDLLDQAVAATTNICNNNDGYGGYHDVLIRDPEARYGYSLWRYHDKPNPERVPWWHPQHREQGKVPSPFCPLSNVVPTGGWTMPDDRIDDSGNFVERSLRWDLSEASKGADVISDLLNAFADDAENLAAERELAAFVERETNDDDYLPPCVHSGFDPRTLPFELLG
jgi:hypothetical protein